MKLGTLSVIYHGAELCRRKGSQMRLLSALSPEIFINVDQILTWKTNLRAELWRFLSFSWRCPLWNLSGFVILCDSFRKLPLLVDAAG